MPDFKYLPFIAAAVMVGGCAVQQSPVQSIESHASTQEQQQAQARVANTVVKPTLKRKVGLGRISNETNYGRSLLRDNYGEPLGKQVKDILAKTLTQSGQFTVVERPDVVSLGKEVLLTGNNTQLVGADVLLIGSLTEFGRKTTGKVGFLSATKRQTAYAKMDCRLVDTTTGVVIFSAAGSGEASAESGSIIGLGSRAAYDGTLNDKAIAQAASQIVNRLVTELANRPWKTYFLSVENNLLAISGGSAQGLKPGMIFVVKTLGKPVKSQQSGFVIRLPGKEVARIRVESTFGETPETEGSVVSVVSGSITGFDKKNLVVEELK